MPGGWARTPSEPHQIKLSANGPMWLTSAVWTQFLEAVDEARKVLVLLDNPHTKAECVAHVRAGRHPLDHIGRLKP